MSLVFGGATSHRVDVGSAASLDALNPYTVLAWIYPTAGAGTRRIWTKGATTNIRSLNTDNNSYTISIGRATTNSSALATVANMSTWALNKWCFVGGTCNTTTATDNRIWHGDLTTLAAEAAAYSSQTLGSGAVGSDAAVNGIIGNRDANDQSMFGRIGVIAVFNRALTLAEVQSWQQRPRILSGCVGLWWLGQNGTGAQADHSGNGNTGTVTGATLGDMFPLWEAPGEEEIYALAPAASITLGATPDALTIQQGDSDTSTIAINRTSFGADVTLTVTGQPAGMTASCSPSPTALNSSTLTVDVGASVALGVHTLTVTGSGSGISNAATNVDVTVTAANSGRNPRMDRRRRFMGTR